MEDAGPDDDAPKEKAIEVMYGADLDTSVTGSGFPVKGRLGVCEVNEETQKLAESHWNLNNLPRLDCSLLKHMGDDVMGVTKPWMYLGMLFSAFCWHIEDHMMYSGPNPPPPPSPSPPRTLSTTPSPSIESLAMLDMIILAAHYRPASALGHHL